jgi:formamidopyrimidine-DNA glycosylase
MSGQMLIAPKRSEREKHTRAIFKFGNQREELRFIDQRTFGWLSLEQYPACIAHIALDIFDKDFSPQLTIEKLLRSKTEIKRALLNQRLISGIGNIYADEALWQSKIHPETQISQLNELDMKKILREVKRVMSRALAAGGSSIDQLYRRVNGESGYFDISLRAYGRQGLPCSRCATPIKRIAFTNRSSHFCPHCQKKRVPPAGAKV